MTTVHRPYINPSYEQAVDDDCLEWKSIPMAVVKDVIKVQHATNDFTGIKQIYNKVPPRPMNINVMATSIARINNLDYNSAVPKIAKQFIDEEVADVYKFVNTSSFDTNTGNIFPEQKYIPEHSIRSSSASPLVPSGGNYTFKEYPENFKKDKISLILGDVAPSSGVVPNVSDFSTQTDWIMNKQSLSQNYTQHKQTYGIIKETGGDNPSGFTKGGFGAIENSSKVGYYREGMISQTDLTKPESGYITQQHAYTGRMVGKEKATFYENTSLNKDVLHQHPINPNQYRANIAYPTKSREVNF